MSCRLLFFQKFFGEVRERGKRFLAIFKEYGFFRKSLFFSKKLCFISLKNKHSAFYFDA